MLTRNRLLALLPLAAALSCGGTGEEGTPATARAASAAASTESRTRPHLPPVISFREWGDRRFFSNETHAVYVLVTRSPDDRTHYRAFGVDVSARQVSFQIDIDSAVTGEFAGFQARLAQQEGEINASLAALDQIFRGGGTTDTSRPPPSNPGGPLGDGFAAELVHLGEVSMRAEDATIR